jgi:hypothetical protein
MMPQGRRLVLASAAAAGQQEVLAVLHRGLRTQLLQGMLLMHCSP